MARTPNKDKEPLVDKLDKLLEQGDPLLAVAMLSTGIASASGIRPPMTRLLMTTSGASSSDMDKILAVAAGFAGGLAPGLLGAGFFLGQKDSPPTEPGAKETGAAFFMGMAECYLMSKLFSNPEFFKMLGSAASQGAGLLKGVAATAI